MEEGDKILSEDFKASSTYTRGIFKKFQEELMEIVSYVPTIIHDDDKKLTMRIKSFEKKKVKHVNKSLQRNSQCRLTGLRT
ncbi:hypothetical protein Taro_052746 [Colocasia esculenta]|uniref:Uncharacterized protein n=1 Tax=Colocasia esculenta TaxID=4460 RepID=A0A843XKS7_COLES|nr:hypothetical protein [Colocasia esculenta]